MYLPKGVGPLMAQSGHPILPKTLSASSAVPEGTRPYLVIQALSLANRQKAGAGRRRRVKPSRQGIARHLSWFGCFRPRFLVQ
jgi:hypothetical protein